MLKRLFQIEIGEILQFRQFQHQSINFTHEIGEEGEFLRLRRLRHLNPKSPNLARS